MSEENKTQENESETNANSQEDTSGVESLTQRLKEAEEREAQLEKEKSSYQEALREERERRKAAESQSETKEVDTQGVNIEEIVARSVEKAVSGFTSTMKSDYLDEELSKIEDPKVREATRLTYEKRIRTSGTDRSSIKQDIEDARRLVMGYASKPDVSKLTTDMSGSGAVEQKAETRDESDEVYESAPENIKKLRDGLRSLKKQ